MIRRLCVCGHGAEMHALTPVAGRVGPCSSCRCGRPAGRGPAIRRVLRLVGGLVSLAVTVGIGGGWAILRHLDPAAAVTAWPATAGTAGFLLVCAVDLLRPSAPPVRTTPAVVDDPLVDELLEQLVREDTAHARRACNSTPAAAYRPIRQRRNSRPAPGGTNTNANP